MSGLPDDTQSSTSLAQAVPDYRMMLSFAILNACNFQIALGAPLILMARAWGASSFYIGAITALVPLLTTLQIYMAPRVEYIGFRQVMLMGWTARNSILFLVMILIFCADWLSKNLALQILFACMIVFNILRGLATTSWMPWLSSLVPENFRGRYISIEQIAINLASAFVLFGSGLVLGKNPTNLHFGLLFLFSVTAGWASLLYLRKINSPPPLPGKPKVESYGVWIRQVWRHRPFRRLIRMNVIFSLAITPWGAFTILFLRDMADVPDGWILNTTGILALGVVMAAWFWGKLADRFGSRPIMAISTRLLLVLLLCWMLLSMNILPRNIITICTLYVVFGIASIGFGIGNSRYCLNNAPKDVPVKALTIFSVITSLCNGFGPMLWGYLLTRMDLLHYDMLVFEFNRYTVFYGASAVLLVITKVMIRKLPDQQAPATSLVLYHMVIDYPLRTINGIYKNVVMHNRKGGHPDNSVH